MNKAERILWRWLLQRERRRLERMIERAAWTRELSTRLDCVIWFQENMEG